MRFPKLQRATLLIRANRFAAWVQTDAGRLYAHVPNSGRLSELLVPGAEVRWSRHAGAARTAQLASGSARKTAGDLILVRHGRHWVCIDSRVPPRLLAEAVSSAAGIEPFGSCGEPAYEPQLGRGRADLYISCGQVSWVVETKSVTLARSGVALFPDAPTERGRRHLCELAALASVGLERPAVAFVCQRPDVYCFRPNAETDPAFAEALVKAIIAGVTVVAYRCSVDTYRIAITDAIPVCL